MEDQARKEEMEFSNEDLKDVVRILRTGKPISFDDVEFILEKKEDKKILRFGNRSWKVQGTERLKVTEIRSVPEKKAKELRPETTEVTCVVCGRIFERSKFNSYMDRCSDCRGNTKKSGTPAVPRLITCSECGIEFEISKFQPYATTTLCPKCRKRKARKEHRQRKQEKARAIGA